MDKASPDIQRQVSMARIAGFISDFSYALLSAQASKPVDKALIKSIEHLTALAQADQGSTP